MLGRIAGECGHDPVEVTRYLSSAEDEEIVRREEEKYRKMWVSMVPTFILGGTTGIVGAENPETLAEAILRCL